MSAVAAILPIGLAIIMATVGLSLTRADFARLTSAPRAVLIGLSAQMLLLPAVAMLLLAVWPLPPEFALGVLLIAAAPGGVTSSLLTLLAGGDVALAITITAISTLASVITLPALVSLGSGLLGLDVAGFVMPVGTVMAGILMTTVLPLALGMSLRWRWPALVARVAPAARRVSTAIFAAIVAFTFFQSSAAFRAHGLTLGPFVLLMNGAAFGAAALLALVAGLGRRQAIAVSIETGLQNAALAIVVAISVLGHPVLAVPAVVFAVTMNVLVIALVPLARRLAGTQAA